MLNIDKVIILISLVFVAGYATGQDHDVPENGGVIYVVGLDMKEYKCESTFNTYPASSTQYYLTRSDFRKIDISKMGIAISKQAYPSEKIFELDKKLRKEMPGCSFTVVVYEGEKNIARRNLDIIGIKAGRVVKKDDVYYWGK